MQSHRLTEPDGLRNISEAETWASSQLQPHRLTEEGADDGIYNVKLNQQGYLEFP